VSDSCKSFHKNRKRGGKREKRASSRWDIISECDQLRVDRKSEFIQRCFSNSDSRSIEKIAPEKARSGITRGSRNKETIRRDKYQRQLIVQTAGFFWSDSALSKELVYSPLI